MAYELIAKIYVKAIFSAAGDMNLVPSDLGEDMIVMAVDSDTVKRIKTATGTVASPEIFADVSLTFNIKKTSPAYAIYKNRVINNGIIDGDVQLFDDANQEWTFSKLSINMAKSFTASGNEVVVPFVLQGNWLVNQQLIAQISA